MIGEREVEGTVEWGVVVLVGDFNGIPEGGRERRREGLRERTG